MKIKVFTAMFQGAGSITCQVCNRRRLFHDGAQVISLDYGDRLKVLSASDGTVVHACGRQHTYYCSRCDTNADPNYVTLVRKKSRGSKESSLTAVCACGNSMVEVEVE